MVTVVQPWSIGVAFVVSGGIGAISGSYPAYRASRLDPSPPCATSKDIPSRPRAFSIASSGWH